MPKKLAPKKIKKESTFADRFNADDPNYEEEYELKKPDEDGNDIIEWNPENGE